MHAELVERKKWISEGRFLHALNFCMLLPGPEATQLAIYAGWLLHGWRGGAAAGILFFLPSFFLLSLLSYLYLTLGALPAVTALFYGLKAAVVALVAEALLRIGKKAVTTKANLFLAVAAFLALRYARVPFPVVILLAGLAGAASGRRAQAATSEGNRAEEEDVLPAHTRPYPGRTRRILAIFAVLWLGPLLLLALGRAQGRVFFQEGYFFSKAALITFGGAYAVLPYIAHAGVETYGWLAPHQMIDGLGLAETTPGPLIMVVTFIGYLAGWKHGGFAAPLAGFLGATVATYFTFLPSFLFIFLGAPHIERIRKKRRFAAALAGITAAVAGVIANLAVFFGEKVLFPETGFDSFAAILTAASFLGLWRYRWNMIHVIAACAGIGLARYALFL